MVWLACNRLFCAPRYNTGLHGLTQLALMTLLKAKHYPKACISNSALSISASLLIKLGAKRANESR